MAIISAKRLSRRAVLSIYNFKILSHEKLQTLVLDRIDGRQCDAYDISYQRSRLAFLSARSGGDTSVHTGVLFPAEAPSRAYLCFVDRLVHFDRRDMDDSVTEPGLGK